VAASSRMLASTSGTPVRPSFHRCNRSASSNQGRLRPIGPLSLNTASPCFSQYHRKKSRLLGMRGRVKESVWTQGVVLAEEAGLQGGLKEATSVEECV
jgi:hypothetical protein